MEYADYHIVYVDNRMSQDLDRRLLQQSSSSDRKREATLSDEEVSPEDKNSECLKSILGEIEEVRNNLRSILSIFNSVHTCTSGDSCMAKITNLESLSTTLQPILVMLGVPAEDDTLVRPYGASRSSSAAVDPFVAYGLSLLQHISNEVCVSSLSKLVVPITMIYETRPALKSPERSSRPSSGGFPISEPRPTSSGTDLRKITVAKPQQIQQCVDMGAIDVLASPLEIHRLHGLAIPAHRAHKEALKERTKFLTQKRARKRSWLGNTDNKPHAYLREAMVSGLMTGICNPDEVPQIMDLQGLAEMDVSRKAVLVEAIGSWSFSGHDWSEEELVHAALLMLRHALDMSELEKWRLTTADLRSFLMASRAAYNDFVNYHNFRHVIDVMQAIFYFLVRIGTLPPYPSTSSQSTDRPLSPIAALLKPFDALTLLITAIGHDVGHPGVNNAFLVALNAPLAQLYNDRSVLEAFHCAAYSQILRRYWKTAFEDIPMRGLMINSILATDMSLHFNYMKDLGNLQDKVHHNNGTDGWSPQILDDYRVLTCALLVKCADISNVARPFAVAAKWADILQHEFANQGVMEKDVGIPTTLFGGPPELGNIIKLGNSQNSFMNIFARPLFEAVSDILPSMDFAVNEMKTNQEIWTQKVRLETSKQELKGSRTRKSSEALLSPRSGSPNRSASQPELSHPEGLPASQPLEKSPLAQAAQAAEESRRASASSIPPHLVSGAEHPFQQDSSRRSSSNINSNPDTTDISRRSSGAFPGASTTPATITTRRLNNSSPSQLQLAPSSESGSRTVSSDSTAENRQPNGRGSEDTLSQFSGTVLAPNESRRSSRGSGGDIMRRGSKEHDIDYPPFSRLSNGQTTGRPHADSIHHRTSSGAHTNNTNASQSTPYSPTGTQATSVLTMDSDEKSSQGRVDSWTSPDRKGIPDVVNIERPGSGHRGRNDLGPDGIKESDVRTSVLGNGSVRSTNSRVLGRKTSRSIFNFWKKRKSTEASP